MKKSWIVLGLIALVIFLGITRPPEPAKSETEAIEKAPAKEDSSGRADAAEKKSTTKKSAAANAEATAKAEALAKARAGKKPVTLLKQSEGAAVPLGAVPYVMDQGLAVVQGDIVVGEPINPNESATGLVMMPTVTKWKTREIPVYVQPNLSHPERVREALELFNDSVIHFVPYTDQEDVLVFEEGEGICKSYVGTVGGKQPIWLAPDCGATEVAHEIMHALGFVHEQNRTDRDDFVEILSDNIEENFKYNFDKLPFETMKMNALSDFDFESLMIYPPTMFAKPGQQSMRSKIATPISPSPGLSPKDKERLRKAYGDL